MSNRLPSVPTFDLVLATVGRTVEVARFVQALAGQTYRNFRLIVVDQNDDDRLATILEPYEHDFSVLRIHTRRGLSRSRNVGLSHLASDIVAFPDDDCHYPPNLLADVARLMVANPQWDGVTGHVVDDANRPSSARWDPEEGEISRFNVWRRALSISIFLRRHLVDEVGSYDETLGVGAGTPYGSGEETDYLLRALSAGFVLHYAPSLTVIHPDNRADPAAQEVGAGHRYGAGMGRVLRKHHYPSWFAYYHIGRAVGGALIALVNRRPLEARFLWAVAMGRLHGWRAAVAQQSAPNI